ncbi:hypothetical protein AQUCO_05700049v1 [Aquilegia coerulea]|uniref:F-box domain-containing protein n=1 Tax=Aquilegia coerulea TaxID=218851 RepID=A0A2G5CFI1_AQUCA|nr:hypothetical protein AQUCO_05700049v1 [Aquilegia coerulea]
MEGRKRRKKLTMKVVLPDHIIEQILSRLPARSLLRFRCVCKTWCNLISDCVFIDLHRKRSIERGTITKLNLKSKDRRYKSYLIPDCANPNQVRKIVYPSKDTSWFSCNLGSCNGLVCLKQENLNKKSTLCVWNPSTRKYATIPQHSPWDDSSSYGFYYSFISNDYKLLKITYQNDQSSLLMVYSFGENTWTNMGDISYSYFETDVGKLFNGAIYWIAYDSNDTKFTKILVAFDLAHETFLEVPMPENYYNLGASSVEIIELAGCLSLVCNNRLVCEVWLMKNYGRKVSWTKLFTIKPPNDVRSFRPLYIASKDEVLVHINNERLFLYDKGNLKQVDIVEKHQASGHEPEMHEDMLSVSKLVTRNFTTKVIKGLHILWITTSPRLGKG